jgi:Zn-dependent protease
MFSRSFRLGALFGFPIHVNVTFLIMLGVVGLTMGGLAAIAVVLIAFASVLLHELGHALVARHLGVRVPRIELHFFGGAAQMADHPRSSGDEIAISAAGPAVSFALAGLSLLLAQLTGAWLFTLLAQVNLIIGAFNLIPALPMDGGRILRALLQRRMGFLRATEASVTLARVIAVGFAIYGIATGHFFLAILAVVLWLMTSAELASARFRHAGGGFADPRHHDDDEGVRVMPRGWQPPRAGGGSGFVVRRYGGRMVIEPIE